LLGGSEQAIVAAIAITAIGSVALSIGVSMIR
jgi:hypothetical protein